MPNVSFRNKPEIVLHIEELDSAGRNEELQAAMATNAVKQPVIKGEHRQFAEHLARENSVYPKVLFRLALKNGKPAGDPVRSDPVPIDMAEYLELEGSRLGNAFIERHPYVTRLCGIVRPDYTVDLEASKAQEAELYRQGWRDSLSKVPGLPAKKEFDDTFDALPPESFAEPGKAAPAKKA